MWTFVERSARGQQSLRELVARHSGLTDAKRGGKLVALRTAGFREAYGAVEIKDATADAVSIYGVALLLCHRPYDRLQLGWKIFREFDGPTLTACPLEIFRRLTPLGSQMSGASELSLKRAHHWRLQVERQIEASTALKNLAVGTEIRFKEKLRLSNGSRVNCFRLERAKAMEFVALGGAKGKMCMGVVKLPKPFLMKCYLDGSLQLSSRPT